MKDSLTVAMITKNAQETIEAALESVKGMGCMLVIDNGSTDATIRIVSQYTNDVFVVDEASFAVKRNLALGHLKTDWVLYVDADEVVTQELRQEVANEMDKNEPGVYKVKRHNYFLGKRMYDDRVERLFHKDKIQGWQGKVHETPVIRGRAKELDSPLLHYTHRDINSMLAKTNEWSEMEAELRLAAKHPPVKWWRLLRIALTVWWQQLVDKKVWRYGREGLFEGYFQVIDKLIVYTKLYERQKRSTE